jgi:hypothetical protein
MGWKSTKTISREKLEKKIIEEIYNIERLSDDTLCQIFENLGDDGNTEIYTGYNYTVGDE